jgi:hypothetical protein
MNKQIASKLNEVAAGMPVVFEWKTELVLMAGWELKLTPLEKFVKSDEELYQIEVPVMVAVEHKQQLKDAYKRGGMEAVQAYHRGVIEKAKNKAIKIQLREN